jgi:putative endonuclease
MPDFSRSRPDRQLSDRQSSERRGRWAERMAVVVLTLKGYRLLKLRFKSGAGEVDLITPRQARRIAAAARIWMALDQRAAKGVCRFDIITVSPYQWPRHIPNAFSADEA